MSTAYIGTKRVTATPMNRLAYNEHRGWKLPEDENGADDGFLVQYDNGYITWSPRDVFEESYRPNTAMTFGLAIEALKQGKRVTRPSWNGKDMWLVLVKPGHYDVGCKTIDYKPEDGPTPWLAPWIGMRTAQHVFTPWAPAQSDVLAEDWQLYGEEVPASIFRVSIPVQAAANRDLFALCKAGGTIQGDPGLDQTDSIKSVKLVKLVNSAGLQFVAHFSEMPKVDGSRREVCISGMLDNETNFSLVIDKERWVCTTQASVAADVDHDMFLVLDIEVVNYNHR